MSRRSLRSVFSIVSLFCLVGSLNSCTVRLNNETNTDVTWDFEDSSQYSFDSEQSFEKGTFVGTRYNGGLTLYPSLAGELSSNWTPQYSSIVGYWKLNGTYLLAVPNGTTVTAKIGPNCTASNTNGTGMRYVTGRLQRSIYFDGVDDYLKCTDPADGSLDFGTNSFTASAWVFKNDYGSTADNPFYKGAGGTNAGYTMFLGSSGNWTARIADGTSAAIADLGTNTEYLGEWIHFVMVVDRETDELRAYVNGALKDTIDITGIGSVSSTTEFAIGGTGSGSNLSKDLIDEVVVWNAALSEDEISIIYERQSTEFAEDIELSSRWTPQFSTLAGYWKLNGNWKDSSGKGNNLSPFGNISAAAESKAGPFAATLDGNGDYADSGTATTSEVDNISMNVWLKWNGTSTGADQYVYQSGNTGLNGMAINISDAPLGEIRLTLGGVASQNTGVILPSDVWAMVTFVRRNGAWEFYLDGEQKSFSFSATPNSPHSAVTRISTGSTNSFSGKIDEVSVWETALTAGEISIIYNRQKQMFSGQYDSPIIDAGSSSSNWTFQSWKTPLPYGKELPGSSGAETEEDYASIYTTNTLSEDLEGYWRFDETAANSVNAGTNDFEDFSGKSRHGDNIGTAVTYGVTGQFRKGLSFSDTGQTIEFAYQPEYSAPPFTVAFWTKLDETSTTKGGNSIWIQNNVSGSPYRNWILLTTPGVDKLWFLVYNSSVGTHSIYSNGKIEAGQWYHIAAKIDSSNKMYTYVNGVRQTQSTTITDLYPSTETLKIGATNTGVGFKGTIDELAFWSRDLKDAEVQQLYRRGANRVRFQVRSCDDSSCDGETFIGPDGTDATYFSELYNCDDLNSDGDCDTEENINLTSPKFIFDSFPGLSLQANRYFQYRAYMEAENNLSCDSACMPFVTETQTGPTDRYFAGRASVKSTFDVNYTYTSNFAEDASCPGATYRLSPDGGINFYYYNGLNWTLSNSDEESSNATAIRAGIETFYKKFGPSENLRLDTFLYGDSCSVDDIVINIAEPSS